MEQLRVIGTNWKQNYQSTLFLFVTYPDRHWNLQFDGGGALWRPRVPGNIKLWFHSHAQQLVVDLFDPALIVIYQEIKERVQIS